MRPIPALGKVLKYGLAALVTAVVLGLVWLRWDAGRQRDAWFTERQGVVAEIQVVKSVTPSGQVSEGIMLASSSGLRVEARTIRDDTVVGPQPVFLVLGGHRTGRDSVDLFGRVEGYAVVGMDYPYAGPEKVRGAAQIIGTLPLARQAILDTVPAVQLLVDWLEQQPWVDSDAIVLVGGSLGVPFAAAVAAREPRMAGVILAHGAAELQPWLEAQLVRRIDTEPLHYPLSVLLYWLAYGPIFDPGSHVGAIAPRPLVVIGALDDERTPEGQVELLFSLAGEPKRLRYTEGMHIEPDRPDIVAALLQIADEEILFLTSVPAEDGDEAVPGDEKSPLE